MAGRRYRWTPAVLAACTAWIGSWANEPRSSYGSAEEARVFVASAQDLEWTSKAIPEGASWAMVYSHKQALVRWQPGTRLPTHVRGGSWHGVVLSGSLLLQVADHAEETLAPLAYFFVLQGTRFSVACRDDAPCVYLVFDTQAEHLEGIDLSSTDARTERLPQGADRRNPGFEMIDLAASKWHPVSSSPSVRRATGQAAVLQAALNFVFPYELDTGAELPRAGTRDVAAFVLAGLLRLRVEGRPEKHLGPGSFFRITGPASYSDSCQEQPCMVLSTDPPPGQRGRPIRVLFPPVKP